MAKRISADLRHLVAARADYLCEYCLLAEDDTFFGCEVDHIISVKHGGETVTSNLAYACVFCNRYKGSDIASTSEHGGALVRFFNPRVDHWSHHLKLQGMHIGPLTDIGEVTVKILRLNDAERVLERQALSEVGRYPNASAMALLKG